MDFFDADELSQMQAAQEAGMMDRCILSKYMDGATDAYGMPLPSWADGPEIRCGYDGRKHWEAGIPAGTPGAQVEITDGRIRLPIQTQITNLDRVRITHRFGRLLVTPIEFEIVGEPRQGPSGLLVYVRKVTNYG